MSTNDKLAAERAAFEAWAERHRDFPKVWGRDQPRSTYERAPDGGYANFTTHVCWEAWQARAALAAEAKPAPAEPVGWKLVPVEPTPEMIEAANEGDDAYTLRCFGPGVQRVMQGPEDHWLAMLAAAPAAPAPVPEADFGNIAKDAERYRWLRDKSEPPHNFYLSVPVEFHGVRYQPHEVDAYIDAAIAASKGGAA